MSSASRHYDDSDREPVIPYGLGTLEMVISHDGQIETVRLRTPLNRFHERMIVTAAKAWRYRRALKNGRPVRFLLVSSINLPGS